MNTISQLSIFLENKSGRLHEIMEIIGKANIRIIAAMVADTSEYGILRLITTDTPEAYRILRENNVSANLSEVTALFCDPQAGTFFEKLKPFSQEGIGIEYMYCFSAGERAILIFRVRDPKQAERIIEKYGLETISEEELTRM